MKKIQLLFCLVFLLSCSNNKIPKDVLKVKEMRNIMWDMMKMDEYYIRKTTNDTLQKFAKENFKLYEQVFVSYGVTKETFYKSYNFYESHPVLFKELIDSVSALSERQKSDVYLKQEQSQ